jgi:hypothetical protein
MPADVYPAAIGPEHAAKLDIGVGLHRDGADKTGVLRENTEESILACFTPNRTMIRGWPLSRFSMRATVNKLNRCVFPIAVGDLR